MRTERSLRAIKRGIDIGLGIVLFSWAVVMSSCSPTVASDSRAADVEAIRALDEQWSAAAAKNDLDGTVGFYADDAVLLPPNAPMAQDRTGIRKVWAGLSDPNAAVTWKASKIEVASSGELGYLYGTYSVVSKQAKGGPPLDTGKIVEVWKKRDGKWKCIVDAYNSDLPAGSSPESKK